MNYNILIYKAESEAGLAEQILSTASLAYFSPVSVYQPSDVAKASIYEKLKQEAAIAALMGTDPELYYLQSILASSNWNKNDDVFPKDEMWLAKYSPINKPDNLGHEEDVIVGHMIDSWAMDNAGNRLAAGITVEELPDLYHIVNNSVIYKTWNKAENIERTNNLIKKIEAGEMYVSMECWFRGFDYALRSKGSDAFTVVPRNEETAFLTKSLRAYKGSGEVVYNGKEYQVGRYLRRLTFTGKGYVEKPANPNSVILDFQSSKANVNVPKNDVLEQSGVILDTVVPNTKRENTMSEVNTKLYDDQITELKAALKASEAKNGDLVTKLSEAGSASHAAKVAELESKLAKASEENTSLKNEVSTKAEEVKTLNTKVEELTAAKTKAEDELKASKAESLKTNRVSGLVSAGLSKEDAEKLVAEFADSDDKAFARISEMAVAAYKKDEKKEEKKDEKKDAKADEKAITDTKVLDEAKPSGEPALASANENANEQVEATRAELASFCESRLTKRTSRNKKGE